MGEVISLTARRASRDADREPQVSPRTRRAIFSFDLSLPGTYLAAERVDQLFDRVVWQPVYAEALWAGQRLRERAYRDELMAAAEIRAAALRIPLVWPEPFPTDIRPAMRAAQLAGGMGCGAQFVLAASRLAFCGGFDLADPEVLAEAAAAAGVSLERCLEAAGDVSRDAAMADAGRRLLAMGASDLPVIRNGRRMYTCEQRIEEAALATRAAAVRRFQRPITI